MIRPCEIRFSAHALRRMQQRSIHEQAVELLLEFADPRPAGGQCTILRFDEQTWAEAVEVLGSAAKRFARFRFVYAIVSDDGVVVTVAWLH